MNTNPKGRTQHKPTNQNLGKKKKKAATKPNQQVNIKKERVEGSETRTVRNTRTVQICEMDWLIAFNVQSSSTGLSTRRAAAAAVVVVVVVSSSSSSSLLLLSSSSS